MIMLDALYIEVFRYIAELIFATILKTPDNASSLRLNSPQRELSCVLGAERHF